MSNKMLFVALLILAAALVGVTELHAQTPVPFVSCQTSGGLMLIDPPGSTGQIVYHCVDPKTFTPAPPVIHGGPCTAPASGVTPYVQLPDGSCLPVIGIPAPGAIAANVTESTQQSDDPSTVTTYHTVMYLAVHSSDPVAQ